MLNKILMVLLMASLTAVASAETVYKWVDATGQVHYTDLPPKQADARILSVTHGPSNMSEDEGTDGADYGDGNGDENGDDAAANAASGATTPEPPVSEETMAAAQDDAARAKVEQCKQAQDRYQKYIESRRLFREEGGKRVYLTDQELAEARARAKQAVDDYCN
ncbi:MAG: DUF4124 domain-containing protein [Steroidobacteraceae bacterium]